MSAKLPHVWESLYTPNSINDMIWAQVYKDKIYHNDYNESILT